MNKETTQFIKQLKKYRGKLRKQTITTLRGQALSGDLKGAELGLKRLIEEASK